MTKVRIVHLITGLNTGGAETMLYKLLYCGDREAFPSAVVSLTGRGALGDKIAALGVPVHALNMNSPWSFAQAPWALRGIVRAFAPDVLQGWMYHGNLMAQLARFLSPKPVSVAWNVRHSLYDLSQEKPLTRVVIRWSKRLSHRVDRIIYNARISANLHEAFGYDASKRAILPNGFDTERFSPSSEARGQIRAQLGLVPETPLIGLIARYHPVKGHHTFLQAAAQLHETDPDVHFVLAGRGVTGGNGDLSQAIGLLKLKHIHLLGERSDMPALTAALDIATSSSYGEGFSNTLGEAMACGVPCVTTDVGDASTIVADTGIVVPARSPEALAEGWRTLLGLGAESRRALGQSARKRIVENFSLGAVVDQYQQLYRRLIEGGGASAASAVENIDRT